MYFYKLLVGGQTLDEVSQFFCVQQMNEKS